MSPMPRLLVACGLVIAVTSGAHAETVKKPEKEAAAGKPALVASYGDWSVFPSPAGESPIFYNFAPPKHRAPADIKRDPAYAFISERPSERVRNEVSFIMGFEVSAPPPASDAKDKKKPDAKERKSRNEVVSPTAVIGDAEFELLPKGNDVWVKNAAEESQLIDEMRRGAKLTIKAASKKGTVTIDSYSLTGFSQAIDRALKDCPGT